MGKREEMEREGQLIETQIHNTHHIPPTASNLHHSCTETQLAAIWLRNYASSFQCPRKLQNMYIYCTCCMYMYMHVAVPVQSLVRSPSVEISASCWPCQSCQCSGPSEWSQFARSRSQSVPRCSVTAPLQALQPHSHPHPLLQS